MVYPPVHLDRLLLSVATPGIQPSHREAGLVRGWALHDISPCPLHDGFAFWLAVLGSGRCSFSSGLRFSPKLWLNT